MIDQLEYGYDYIEEQEGLLSYLTYTWHEEKFEEYRQAWVTLNDEYTHNGSTVLRYDDVKGDIDVLNEIAVRAEELGIDPSDVYDRFYDHLERLNEMREADSDYQRNEMEFRDWS